MWVLCAASLPLIAYAIQQRAHGEFFQTSPRLQGVLGYPNAIGAYAALAAPAALWLASSRQRARRVAGCGTLALLVLGLALVLVARRRAGRSDRLRGLAGRLRPAHRERRGAARRARRDRAGGALGARPALLQGARRPLHRARRLAPGLVLARGRARRPRCSARWPWSSLSSQARASAAPAASRSLAVAVVGALLAAVRLSSQHGGPIGALSHVWHQLSGGGAVGSTDHLTQLSTNLRGRWWGEAWDGFTAHPWRGNGAGTFETIDRLARPDFQQAGQEHSAFLHVLSGTGLLGAIPAVIALAPRAPARPPSRACAEPSAPRRSHCWRASVPSRCTTRSTGSGSRPRSRCSPTRFPPWWHAPRDRPAPCWQRRRGGGRASRC